MRSITIVASAALAIALTAPFGHATLIISGVVDGNEAGGLPKGVELVALQNIPDLSVYSIGRYTNGGSTLTSVTALPSVALSQGSFFYITGTASSDAFFTSNGFTVGLSNQTVANINGDDLLSIVLTTNNAIAIDTFGLPGQGDTDFYTDSIAYRNNASQTGVPAGLLDASNFDISGWISSARFGAVFGEFVVTAVPEASSFLIGGLVCSVIALKSATRAFRSPSVA
jgi:hypothetical protein